MCKYIQIIDYIEIRLLAAKYFQPILCQNINKRRGSVCNRTLRISLNQAGQKMSDIEF